MPAYFNINIQFERKDIYPSFVKDLYSAFEDCEMKFKCGYWNSENNTFDEIIEFNQRLLENNFTLGYTQSYEENYKQMLFDFANFEDVRCFIMNKYPNKEEFSFEIIIPEYEVLKDCTQILFTDEQIHKCFDFAKKIWEFKFVKAIQTGLECREASVSLNKMKVGVLPNICPFAIIEESCLEYLDVSQFYNQKINKSGVVLMDKKMWK